MPLKWKRSHENEKKTVQLVKLPRNKHSLQGIVIKIQLRWKYWEKRLYYITQRLYIITLKSIITLYHQAVRRALTRTVQLSIYEANVEFMKSSKFLLGTLAPDCPARVQRQVVLVNPVWKFQISCWLMKSSRCIFLFFYAALPSQNSKG